MGRWKEESAVVGAERSTGGNMAVTLRRLSNSGSTSSYRAALVRKSGGTLSAIRVTDEPPELNSKDDAKYRLTPKALPLEHPPQSPPVLPGSPRKQGVAKELYEFLYDTNHSNAEHLVTDVNCGDEYSGSCESGKGVAGDFPKACLDSSASKASGISVSIQLAQLDLASAVTNEGRSARTSLTRMGPELYTLCPRKSPSEDIRMMPRAPLSARSMNSPRPEGQSRVPHALLTSEPRTELLKRALGESSSDGLSSTSSSSGSTFTSGTRRLRGRNVIDEFCTSSSSISGSTSDDWLASRSRGRSGRFREDPEDDTASSQLRVVDTDSEGVAPRVQVTKTRKGKPGESAVDLAAMVGIDEIQPVQDGPATGKWPVKPKKVAKRTPRIVEIVEEETVDDLTSHRVQSMDDNAEITRSRRTTSRSSQKSSFVYDSARQLHVQDGRRQRQKSGWSVRTRPISIGGKCMSFGTPSASAHPNHEEAYQTVSTGSGATKKWSSAVMAIGSVAGWISGKIRGHGKAKKAPSTIQELPEESKPPAQHRRRYMKRQETIRNVIEDGLKSEKRRTRDHTRRDKGKSVIFQPIHDSVTDLHNLRNSMTDGQYATYESR